MSKRIVLLICVATSILFAVDSAAAQMAVTGEVIEVVDGKTVLIAAPSGRVKAELQYIDVPEPNQPLYEMVKEHLGRLVLGKVVNYRAQTLLKDRAIGRMTLNNVDISLQMLRDGAAWHIAASESGQAQAELASYSSSEKDAKNEKRGVWSVPGLKSGSDLRANKPSSMAPTKPVVVEEPRTASLKLPVRRGYWSDKNPALGDVGVLANGYNAESKNGFVGTSLLGVKETEADKVDDTKTALDITYFYREIAQSKRKGVFVVTIVSESGKVRFLARNDLVIVCDEKKTPIGKPKREASSSNGVNREKLTYQINRDALDKIVNGSEVVLKVGDYLIKPEAGLQMLLYNMLQIAE